MNKPLLIAVGLLLSLVTATGQALAQEQPAQLQSLLELSPPASVTPVPTIKAWRRWC